MNRPSTSFWPPPGKEPIRDRIRSCDHPGCAETGEHRAPKSRASLNEYYWFCLDHVRAYNSAWDYCAGMSADDIEAMVRSDTTWQRASWPLGRLMSGRLFRIDPERIKDPFGLFGEEFWRRRAGAAPKVSPEDDAKRVMELKGTLTVTSLKTRYKELCKRHHPDANGGSKAAEERFKQIGQAYRTLLASLSY
jgi:hypothetical protein